jgi:hypothetical protein
VACDTTAVPITPEINRCATLLRECNKLAHIYGMHDIIVVMIMGTTSWGKPVLCACVCVRVCVRVRVRALAHACTRMGV